MTSKSTPTPRRTSLLATFYTLRRQMPKPAGEAEAPWPTSQRRATPALTDYLGAFAVTTGIGADELAAKYEAQNDDYNAILAKAAG